MFQVKAFVFSPVQENTYLLYREHGQAMIIDPGCYYPEEKVELSDFIAEKQLQPTLLLNTHCHLDHVFGNRWVHETYGLHLHLHPQERPVLEMAPASGLMWNLPFDQYEGPLIDLQPGASIDFGEDCLEILFAPGHSPGHVCFYCRKQGFLIGGDVLFRESIGRTDLPGGNHAQLIRSIQTQLLTLPDETIVYSGHGVQTTIGHERQFNPFLQG